MVSQLEHDSHGEEIYLAGERVLPGTYRQVGGMREVRLDHEDILPASLDGRVACYMRISNTWGQLAHRNSREHAQTMQSSKI